MSHYLVMQLRFTRREFLRCLQGVTPEEATRRFEAINCISWMVGHLASQENFLWVRLAQGRKMETELVELVATGKPASTPPLQEMWRAWRAVTEAADTFLEGLTEDQMSSHLIWRGQPWRENVGTMLLRNIHHYWFHMGEAYAVRQLLGHTDLPEFVGSMTESGYPTPESGDSRGDQT